MGRRMRSLRQRMVLLTAIAMVVATLAGGAPARAEAAPAFNAPGEITLVQAQGQLGDPAVRVDVSVHRTQFLWFPPVTVGRAKVTLPDGKRIFGVVFSGDPIRSFGVNGAELVFGALGPGGFGTLTTRLEDRDAVGAGRDRVDLSGTGGARLDVAGELTEGRVVIAPTQAPPPPPAPDVTDTEIETDRASVVVTGSGPPGATVIVDGPNLPPTFGTSDDTGAFTVEVPVPFATTTSLEVRTIAPGSQTPSAPTVVAITQLGVRGSAVVTGTVIDGPGGVSLADAVVSYGALSTSTDAEGRFRLEGLPEGPVTLRIRAGGHLTGTVVVPAHVADDTTPAPDVQVALVAENAAGTIGPAGGTLEIDGVRLRVPARALAAPTTLSITRPAGGATVLDARWGPTLVDLGPTGTQFARPAQVELDLSFTLPVDLAVVLRLVNPDTGANRRVDARVGPSGRTLLFEVTELDGASFSFDPVWLLGVLGQDSDEACTPYATETQANIAQFLALAGLEDLLAFAVAWGQPNIGNLWDLYTTGAGGFVDIDSGVLIDGDPSRNGFGGFRTHPATILTRRHIDGIMLTEAGRTLPSATPEPQDISTFPEAFVHAPTTHLNYTAHDPSGEFTVPGLIAGGIDAIQVPPDTRRASGVVMVSGTYDARGVLTAMTVDDDALSFTVRDTLDFCPGNLGGEIAQELTVRMSRLEAHGRFRDVNFEVRHGPEQRGPVRIINPASESSWNTFIPEAGRGAALAQLYDNDRDRDGWPERLPAELATLHIDNCAPPRDASFNPADFFNPDQADEDNDGIGDVCDDQDDDDDPPSSEPREGKVFGDPHVRTFDRTTYSFQAGGEFVTVRDPDDPGFVVQQRFDSRGRFSNIDGLAVNVEGDEVVVFGLGPALVNGEEVAESDEPRLLPGGGILRFTHRRVEIEWPDGSLVFATRRGIHLPGGVRLAATRSGVEGLLGNGNGVATDDVLTTGGDEANTFDEIYNDFGPRWVVPDAERLFPGERRPYTLPSSPPPTVAELDPAALAAAAVRCRAAGFVVGRGLDQCIYDLALSGDTVYADAAVAAMMEDDPLAAHNINSPDVRSSIFTLAGDGETDPGDIGDAGPAIDATLFTPLGVDIDEDGNVYIADSNHHRIRRIAPDGIINTVAGNGTRGFSGDGGPASGAQVARPSEPAVGADGSVYIADTGNRRVRRIAPDGIISTVAGTGGVGDTGDGGPATAARFTSPTGVSTGPGGSLFVVDAGAHKVRRIGPDGIISTVAGSGTPGFSGDGGPATQAQLDEPTGISVSPAGVLYVADSRNHRVRRVGLDGIITTFAGTGTSGYAGDGGPATSALLERPEDIKVGPRGEVIVADTANHVLRLVDPAGRITTIAGDGSPGFRGDGGPARSAQLDTPAGVSVDDNGDIYIADAGNHRIRVMVAPGEGSG